MMAAADRITIEITGRGGHGAHAYQPVDVMLVAAHIITAAQSIVSRNVPPLETAIITVGAFLSGEAANGSRTVSTAPCPGVEDALTVRFNASMSLPICTARRSGGVACWPETPALLAGQAGIRDVAAYANDVCVVGATGQLRCGETELSDVPGVPDAVAVVASDDNFFALRRGGQPFVRVERMAGAAFAQDQHGQVVAQHAGHQAIDRLHRR